MRGVGHEDTNLISSRNMILTRSGQHTHKLLERLERSAQIKVERHLFNATKICQMILTMSSTTLGKASKRT
jgi:hypothetical protein